jgi:hypothetical protein
MVPGLTGEQRARVTELLTARLAAAWATAVAAGADPGRLAAVVARRRRDVQAMIGLRHGSSSGCASGSVTGAYIQPSEGPARTGRTST